MTKDILQEIVECIVEQADELSCKEHKNDMDRGILLGLAESLSIIRDACAGYDLSEIGLDFDIDEKYLYTQK